MISIKKKTYTSTEALDKLLSRMAWKVAKVDDLPGERPREVEISTHRPLIGVIEDNDFWLWEPRRFYLDSGALQIIAKGRITEWENACHVTVRYKLAWGTTLTGCIMLLWSIFFTAVQIDTGFDLLGLWVITALLVPVVFAYLISIRLKHAENKIEDLFGVD